MSALWFGQRFSKSIVKPLCKCNIYYSQLHQTTPPNRLFSSVTDQHHLLRSITNLQTTQIATYYTKKKEKQAKLTEAQQYMLGGLAVTLLGAGVWYLGQPDPDSTKKDPYADDYAGIAHLCRARDSLWDVWEAIAEPSQDLLLPGPLPAPYMQPPYTLVIELEDVLIHSEHDPLRGWRYRKRPGVDQFLRALTNPLFEIVIFTRRDGNSMLPVVEALDKEGVIMYRLFKDSTRFTDNTHVKDLSRLNRDLRKVILMDCDADAAMLQPRNSFIMKKWEGDTKDISLLELIPLFQTISMSNVDDVRTVMDHYRDEADPVAAFRRNQDLMRQQQMEAQEALQKQQDSALKNKFSLFGSRRR